jgi:hypothetical protein
VGRPRKAIINSSSFSLKARKIKKISSVLRGDIKMAESDPILWTCKDLFRIWIEPLKSRSDPNNASLKIISEFLTVNTWRGEGQQELLLKNLSNEIWYHCMHRCTVYWSVLVSRIKIKNKCCHSNKNLSQLHPYFIKLLFIWSRFRIV